MSEEKSLESSPNSIHATAFLSAPCNVRRLVKLNDQTAKIDKLWLIKFITSNRPYLEQSIEIKTLDEIQARINLKKSFKNAEILSVEMINETNVFIDLRTLQSCQK